MKKKKFSFIAGGNAKWYNHFGRHLGDILQKLNILFTTQSRNHTKEVENLCLHKNLHAMLTAALFIYVKIRKQPGHSSVGKWINSTINSDNEILFSAKKKRASKL